MHTESSVRTKPWHWLDISFRDARERRHDYVRASTHPSYSSNNGYRQKQEGRQRSRSPSDTFTSTNLHTSLQTHVSPHHNTLLFTDTPSLHGILAAVPHIACSPTAGSSNTPSWGSENTWTRLLGWVRPDWCGSRSSFYYHYSLFYFGTSGVAMELHCQTMGLSRRG
jgi:hypothetical protein